MADNPRKLYGLVARFADQEALIDAAGHVYQEGFRNFDAYTPYPVEELSRAMRLKSSPLPYFMFAGGLFGAVGGLFMQAFAAVDYPLDIGGRPLFSWPTYIPITFELVILFAALGGILGLFFFTRLPQPYHPVFNFEDFLLHGSQDGFYLGIEASDPKFDLERTRQYLQRLQPVQVAEVEA
ncbi:MAG: DUF3341 domain-containing protein [Anaerolineaceae bacterium]|nr:DUF3341 domain-containing protein [Anaerolineaceae bacterium]